MCICQQHSFVTAKALPLHQLCYPQHSLRQLIVFLSSSNPVITWR